MAKVYGDWEEVGMEEWEDVPSGGQTVTPKIKEDIKEVTQKVISEKEPGFLESINTPTDPETFSYGRVGASTLAGAGIGLALPIPGGTLGGGAAGFASGVAGEVSRAFGNRPWVTFGIEAFGGEIPMALKKVGGFALNKIYKNRETAEAFNKLLKTTSEEDVVILRAKENLFGKDTFKGMFSTKNSDKTQALLKDNYKLVGTSDQKASDIYRAQLYDEIDSIASKQISDVNVTPEGRDVMGLVTRPEVTTVAPKPKTFINSAEGKALIEDLKLLKERPGKISSKEYANTMKILLNQNSTNPKLAKKAKEDIINLIQNGGLYTAGSETKQVTSKEGQKLLREYFGQYLEKNLGANKYNILKDIERQEIISIARDSIPTLLTFGFKYTDEAFQSALKNISQSPEGKIEFANAINQHLKNYGKTVNVKGKEVGANVSPDDLISELGRLFPAIEKAGIMSRETLSDLSIKIKSLPKNINSERRKKTAIDLVTTGISSAIAAEAPIRAEKQFNFTIPTL